MRVSKVLRAAVAIVAVLAVAAVSYRDAIEGSGVSRLQGEEKSGGGAWEA